MSLSVRFRICFALLCILGTGTTWGQETQASPFALNPQPEQNRTFEDRNAQNGINLEHADQAQEASQSDSAGSFSSTFSIADNSQPVDFLPIDQAYQATVFFSQGKLKVDWQISDGYYLYKDRFKFQQHENSGTVPLNAEFEVGKRIFDQVFEKELEVYYHNTQIKLQNDVSGSNQYRLTVEFQGCADAGLCYPPHTLWYTVNTESGKIYEAPAHACGNSSPGSSFAQDSLLSALIFAFLGGLILNLMPCVFPVLSIKALSLAEASNSAPNKQLHGWSYTTGAVVSFVAIAALMLILKSSGQAIGWGFQLQSPTFVSLLAYLFFAMGLSLAGLAEFGNRLMGLGQQLTQKSGYQGSFFTGVLACVVASPCTAPFMGTALGYALGQNTAVALSVFAALGFGMATPFLLLSYIPKLGNYLPKPGPWMETFKQALAFPLFIAATWLLWVLGRQAGGDAVALSLVGLTLIAFGLWLLRYRSLISKIMAIASIALTLALPGLMSSLSPQSSNSENNGFWQSYSKARLDKALANQRSVFINATAAWCLTCLANERIAFSEAFEQQLEQQGTIALKADWTNYDANITSLLQSHGRNGVPLYVFYNQGEVTILPQLLTEEILLKSTKAHRGG